MFRRSGLGLLCVLTSAGAMWLPASAAAKTKVVTAGPPASAGKIASKYVPKSFVKVYSPDINAFFNRRTTINVGDKVSFQLHGFHTVDLPGKSGKDLPLIVPGPVANGFKDAAGTPFWFSGKLPELSFDPLLFSRSKGKSYSGKQRLDSGLPLSPKVKPFTVRFTKAGTYKFFCDVHPGMVGYVTVKAKGKAIPSAQQDQAAQVAQVTGVVKSAVKLSKTKPPKNTVSLGESTPSGGELFAMFPATLSVKAGTTVTFRMSAHSRETHTATFGPISYLKPLAKSFQGGPFISPIATYPSDPTTPITLSSSSHGNGFANTGTLDNDPTTPPGSSSRITFQTPGTYQFYCMVHPFMHGTIIVTK